MVRNFPAMIMAGLWLVYPFTNSAAELSGCTPCTTKKSSHLKLDIGPMYVDGDAFDFGHYTGFEEKGFYPFVDLFGVIRNDGKFSTVEAHYRNDKSNFLRIIMGQQSKYSVNLNFQNTPSRDAEGLTPYNTVGGSLLLPPTWVSARSTNGMTNFDSTASPVALEKGRRFFSIGLDYKALSNWQLTMDFDRQKTSGATGKGVSFLFSALELAQPVDHQTDIFSAGLGYIATNWQSRLTIESSQFRNDQAAQLWDNAYTNPPGGVQGQLARAPDNDAHRITWLTSASMPKRSRLTAVISLGSHQQDEALLPYTVNPDVASPGLPRETADTKLATTDVNLRFTSRPFRPTFIELQYKYTDRDNRSAENSFTPVNTDSTPTYQSITNSRYSFTHHTLRAKAEYRLISGLKLRAGAGYQQSTRTRQSRKETETLDSYLGLQHRLNHHVDYKVELFGEQRRGSTYRVETDSQQHPDHRLYNLADRERVGVRVRGGIYPMSGFDLGWDVEFGTEDYDDTELGLIDGSYYRFGLTANYQFRQLTVYANGDLEQSDSTQVGSQSFSSQDWTSDNEDIYSTLSFGVRHPGLPAGLVFSFDYTIADAEVRISSNTSGLPNAFPDNTSRRKTMNLSLSRDLNRRVALRLDYIQEKLESSDWRFDDVLPLTVPNLLSLGRQANQYDIDMVLMTVEIRVGE